MCIIVNIINPFAKLQAIYKCSDEKGTELIASVPIEELGATLAHYCDKEKIYQVAIKDSSKIYSAQVVEDLQDINMLCYNNNIEIEVI